MNPNDWFSEVEKMAKKTTKEEKLLRDSAHGQTCTVRIPGVCNNNPETVILAHLNGAGMAMKFSGVFGAHACSNCHAWLDVGYVRNSSRKERDLEHYRAMKETQERWLSSGLLQVVP